jgi:hypothetical protein
MITFTMLELADHTRLERFPPKACPGPDPVLFDFGDKEALLL